MSVEQSGDVTFVNGIAAEQQTEGETAQPADERAAAIAAVKEALKSEGKKAAAEAKDAIEQDPLRPRKSTERSVDGKFVSTEKPDGEPKAKSQADDEAEESRSLKAALANRKQIASQKAAIAQEQARAMAEIRQAQQEIAAQRAEVARERQRIQMLRSDPVRAIRENGWDPEEFIVGIAQEGTPEGQARRQQRELQAQLAEMNAWRKEQAESAQRAQEEAQTRQQAQYRQQVEQTFLKVALDDDKHPHLSSYYKGHEHGLIAEADVIAEQYRHLTGKEATFEDIAEYLEERQAKWYKSFSARSGAQQSQQAPASVSQGRPTQGNATGRTLTPQASSERRSLGAALKDLDGDERLAAAREAVASAIHASGER